MWTPRYALIVSQRLLAAVLVLLILHPESTWARCVELTKRPAPFPSVKAATPLRLLEPDGSSPDRAFRFDPASKAIQRIALSSGSPCYVQFSVPLSTRLELSFEGDSTVDLPALQITTTDRAPIHSIEGRRTSEGRGVVFDLYAASYLLKAQMAPASHRKRGAANKPLVVAAASWAHLSPRWTLSPAARAPLRLDPIARLSEREIVVSRRSLITFSLNGVPALPQNHPWVRIDLFDSDWEQIKAAEYSAYEAQIPRASFIVPAGTYYVVPHNRYNGWPSPELEEPLRSVDLTLTIEAITPADLSPAMQRFNNWILEVGLGGLIEISEVLDLREPARNLPGALERLGPYAVAVARYREKEKIDPISDSAPMPPIIDYNNIPWPASVDAGDRPVLVIRFALKTDNRATFEATEDALERSHGISMWNRLLQRVSALEGLPARAIAMEVPVPCDPDLVFITSAGAARRHGSTCMSASSSAPLFSAAALSQAAISNIRGPSQSLGSGAPRILRNYFPNASTTLEFLTTDDDFIEVIVRGLRGWVVRGGADWEKLQLTLALTGEKTAPTLRVTADGDLASGLGDYPPDSSFTRSMEPQYKGFLSDFAKKLANDLARQMTQNTTKEKQ